MPVFHSTMKPNEVTMSPCNICFVLVALQVVQQEPTGMTALRSVPAQMGEFVNWTDLASALKDLLDPTAQRKVCMWNSFSLTV